MPDIIIQFVVAVFATLAFAALFSAPKKELLLCGINGAVGWVIYYMMTADGNRKVFASLTATLALTLLSRYLAVRRQKPATVYLLPGIFPLVPGAGIYYTAYYLFTGDPVMGGTKGLETFEIAGAIVIGIIMGAVVPQGLFNKMGHNPNPPRGNLDPAGRNFH